MSFTYENFYLSGYNSGTLVSGIQAKTPIYCIVSGLKYGGSPVTTGHYAYFTGVFIGASGNLTADVSGYLGFSSTDDEYRGIIVLDDTSGLYASGCLELYWNSGAVNTSTGIVLPSGFELFNNFDETAWNIITKKNSAVNNADGQHSHAAYAQNLSDLDDVGLPSAVDDGDALIYNAASGGWTTGDGGGDPDDWAAVSGEVAEITGTVYDYKVVSGAFVSTSGSYVSMSGNYVTTSGNYVATSGNYVSMSGNYVVMSGGYVLTSGDYVTTSGAYVAVSGVIDDYAVFSGAYAASSGDVSDYKIVSGVAASISDYAVVSGDYAASSGDLSDYKIVSGAYVSTAADYITTSGAVSDYPAVSGVIDDYAVFSGAFSTTSGALSDYAVVSGDYAATSGTIGDYPTVSGSHSSLSGAVADYPTVSGSHSSLSGALSDYGVVSGSYAETSGVIDDYAVVSGAHATVSGAVADYGTVSGSYAITSGAYAAVSGDYAATSGTIADYPTVSGVVAELGTPYTDADARGAINDIIGSDGKLDEPLDFDGNRIDNISFINLKENVIGYLALRSAFTTDHFYHGTVMAMTTNGGSFGVPMYSDTTADRASVCVDTAIATMPCIGLYLAADVLFIEGTIRDDTWNFSIGVPVYVNGSVLSTTIPPDVGDVVQVVGVSISADSMIFKPSLDWVVRK